MIGVFLCLKFEKSAFSTLDKHLFYINFTDIFAAFISCNSLGMVVVVCIFFPLSIC